MTHEKKTIDETTMVPIGWVWKALLAAVAAVPVIGWGFTMTVKLDYTAKAVEPIPKLQQDVATLLERSNKELTIGPKKTDVAAR